MTPLMPLLTPDEAAVELADIDAALARALTAQPVSRRAVARKWERVFILRRWRADLAVQVATTAKEVSDPVLVMQPADAVGSGSARATGSGGTGSLTSLAAPRREPT